MSKKRKAVALVGYLHRLYHGVEKKDKSDPFRVLVSTVLSHRTKDETTDAATERIFSLYDTPEKLAEARVKHLEKLIKPVGFYRVKAKRLKQISSILIEEYDGKVPESLEELLRLPGVGRKTANCVLVFAFDKPALPVDTHVHRISNRLGLVMTKEPYETEKALTKIIPSEEFGFLNSHMVKFGKEICRPIRPRCWECGLRAICEYFKKRTGSG